METKSRFDPWFIHDRLVLGLLDEFTAVDVHARLVPDASGINKTMNAVTLSRAVSEYLDAHRTPNGGTEYLAGKLTVGQIVWFEQAFFFKGVSKASIAGALTGPTFQGKLDIAESVTVRGAFNPQRLTSASSVSHLSGRETQFVLCRVDNIGNDEIHVTPILLGHRLNDGAKMDDGYLSTRLHIHPSKVDQFKGVDFGMRLNPKDLALLKPHSEEKVKNWFADILGEPERPKDWGGEQYDLWTSRMTIGGEHHSAAFMFKGPAAFTEMKISTLGKNGDQIDRIAETDADILVVQHCHKISSRVRNMLRAYALQPGNLRRYMTIDGYETIQILRHHGHI